MLPWVLVLGAAVASPSDGFATVREAEGCVVAMRPESHADGAAMRATCHWPEVDRTSFLAMLADFGRYTEYVWPIAVSEVRREEAGRALVYQRQEIFGMADREVLLWMRVEPLPDGARFSWTTAHDEPLILDAGSVRVPRNDGSWQVTAHPEGGVAVVHQVAIDAGGSIPRWIVAMVRTRGFVRVMGDVREIARQESVTARAPAP